MRESSNMRIGVLSDPHGCLIGLESTIKWLKKRVDIIVCAGDITAFGPMPNECLDILVSENIQSILGNSDEEMLLPNESYENCSERILEIRQINNWCRDQLSSKSRTLLESMPIQYSPDPEILVVHGGINNSSEIIEEENDNIIPDKYSIVAAGHLHKPFVSERERGIWVNAGSCGRSCDGDPRASAAILEKKNKDWSATIHRIDYSEKQAVEQIISSGIPHVEKMIRTQKEASWWY